MTRKTKTKTVKYRPIGLEPLLVTLSGFYG